MPRSFSLALLIMLLGLPASAEEIAPPPAEEEYVLGPKDVIRIHALQADEISDRDTRIDQAGVIQLPLIGTVQAGGLTVRELETVLAAKLRRYVREPQVAVSVTEYRSQQVTVVGAVVNPGVHTLQGPKRLLETVSEAGGLRDDASYKITITRKKENGGLPLDGAADDGTGEFSVAVVNLRTVMDGEAPAHNIFIRPGDVISVPKADLVYVIGDVQRPGGFVLEDRDTVSVVQAIALAAGLQKTAAKKKARIIRAEPGEMREEIPVNLAAVLAGKREDLELQPDDILLVPGSKSKAALERTLNTALTLGTGIIIWR